MRKCLAIGTESFELAGIQSPHELTKRQNKKTRMASVSQSPALTTDPTSEFLDTDYHFVNF